MFEWLRNGDLPPVGTPVVLDGGAPLPRFGGYSAIWLDSGTSALAVAMRAARVRRPEVTRPAVLLPAYGCPDLIAAAQFAGVRAILSDIRADHPGYDPGALEANFTADVVAVVAVNFLGIRDDLPALLRLARARNVALIEDNAQWYPEPDSASALCGDLVCLSFGRGKPVNLLGGGAILAREGFEASIPGEFRSLAATPQKLFDLRARAFNWLLDRRRYWLINRNPAFSVGETKYVPLEEVHGLGTEAGRMLAPTAAAHLRRSRSIEASWRNALSALRTLRPVVADSASIGRLLRFPALCVRPQDRDHVVARLQEHGLGATAMYKRALPAIPGLGQKFELPHAVPGAEAFAARLVTLPVHDQVTDEDVSRVAALLERDAD